MPPAAGAPSTATPRTAPARRCRFLSPSPARCMREPLEQSGLPGTTAAPAKRKPSPACRAAPSSPAQRTAARHTGTPCLPPPRSMTALGALRAVARSSRLPSRAPALPSAWRRSNSPPPSTPPRDTPSRLADAHWVPSNAVSRRRRGKCRAPPEQTGRAHPKKMAISEMFRGSAVRRERIRRQLEPAFARGPVRPRVLQSSLGHCTNEAPARGSSLISPNALSYWLTFCCSTFSSAFACCGLR